MKLIKTYSGLIALFMATTLLLAGCSNTKGMNTEGNTNPSENTEAQIKVIATLFPQYDFTKQIAGDKASVRLLMPPGTEAHSYEPTPKDLVDIRHADVFIYTSFAMEPWVEKILAEVGSETLIINATEGVTYYTSEEMGLPHDEHSSENPATQNDQAHEGVDPHVWLDPANASMMASNVAKGLIQADPQNETLYTQNLTAYKEALASLDKEFSKSLSPIAHKEIVFAGHYAFGYLSKKYDIAYHSPYAGFSPDAEPSPQNIAAMIDLMKSENQKVVYYEELIDPKIARVIASETGAEMVMLHAAHNVSKEDLNNKITYIDIMKNNLEKLVKGLSAHE